MRTSAEICEELLSGLDKKDLDNLKQETTTLKNYGVLSFEDYQKVNGAIEEEAALRFNLVICQEEFDDPDPKTPVKIIFKNILGCTSVVLFITRISFLPYFTA